MARNNVGRKESLCYKKTLHDLGKFLSTPRRGGACRVRYENILLQKRQEIRNPRDNDSDHREIQYRVGVVQDDTLGIEQPAYPFNFLDLAEHVLDLNGSVCPYLTLFKK